MTGAFEWRRKRSAKRAAGKARSRESRKARKHVYFFGNGKADGNRHMKDLLGGKGSGLAEMTNAGLPVPPGFTISTEVCNIYYKEKAKIPPAIDREIDEQRRRSSRRPPARRSGRPTTRCSCRSARARSSRCPA